MSIFDKLFRKETIEKADRWTPLPAYESPSTNWEVLERSFQHLKGDVLADYNEVGNPLYINSTVYTCVKKIATNVSQVPYIIYNSKTNEPVPYDNPLARLFRYINVNDNRFNFWEEILISMELSGKAFIIADGFKGNTPSYMWVANPDLTAPRLDKQGQVVSYRYGTKSKYFDIPAEQVVFLKYTHPENPYDGLAPITAARLGILMQYYAYRYTIGFFKNGAQSPGFLKRNGARALTEDQKREINSAWKNATHGNANAHQIPVFSSDLDYVSLGISQKDMEFLQQINHAEDEILKIFQIPKSLLGYADTTFNNMAEAKKAFWTETLLPKMRLIEDTLNTNFFDRLGFPFYGKFDRESIPELQEDRSQKADTELKTAQAAQIYLMAGVPFEAVNERLELGFENVKAPEPVKEYTEKDFENYIKKYERRKAIDREKRLLTDDVLLKMEWQRTEKAMEEDEPSIVKKIQNYWKDQFRLVIGKLKEEKADEPEIEELIRFIQSLKWEEEFPNTITEEIENTFIRGAQRTFWGVGINFNLTPARTLTFLANRRLKLAESPQVVKDALIDGIRNGNTNDEIASVIKHQFQVAEKRAKAIARTETTAAYNGGRVAGMEELGIKHKQWVHSGDSNVRDSHRIKQTVSTTEPFTLLSGVKVMLPGDGPAEEAVNCRCTVISVLDDDIEQLLENY